MAEGLGAIPLLGGRPGPLARRSEGVHRIDELGRELLAHALAASLASRLHEPADAEGQAPIAPDLDRDLVGGAADAARLDLDDRRGVAERRLEDLEARPLRRRLGPGQRLPQDPLGEVALAVLHELHVEARGRPVDRDLLVFRLAGDAGATWHLTLPADGRCRLGAVLAATLLAVADAGGVEGAADDVIFHRRQVLDLAAADH